MTEQEKKNVQSAIDTVLFLRKDDAGILSDKTKDDLLLAMKALYFYRTIKDTVESGRY